MRNNYLHAAINQTPKAEPAKPAAPVSQETLDDGLDGDTADIDTGDSGDASGSENTEQDTDGEEPNPTLSQRVTALEERYAKLEESMKHLVGDQTVENENPPPSLASTSEENTPTGTDQPTPCQS